MHILDNDHPPGSTDTVARDNGRRMASRYGFISSVNILNVGAGHSAAAGLATENA